MSLIFIDLPVKIMKGGHTAKIVYLRYTPEKWSVDIMMHPLFSVDLPLIGKQPVVEIIGHPFAEEACIFLLHGANIPHDELERVEQFVAMYHDSGWRNCQALLEAVKEVNLG